MRTGRPFQLDDIPAPLTVVAHADLLTRSDSLPVQCVREAVEASVFAWKAAESQQKLVIGGGEKAPGQPAVATLASLVRRRAADPGLPAKG